MRAASLTLSLSLLAAPLEAQWPPERLENLQVLPEDIPVRQLIDMMAGFTRALGVRCTHCHVGEEGRPITSYDFVSDDKPTKAKARQMIRMVQVINAQHLATLEQRNEPPVEVECVTCHHGITTPRQIEDILLLAYDAGGLDSSLAAYRALREEYYGRAAYDFGGVPLTEVAEVLGQRGRLTDAVAVHETNVEYSPESVFAQRMHAGAALSLAFDADGEAGVAEYRRLRDAYGEPAFPEWQLNGLGYALLRRGKTDAAIRVFQLNVEAYPESANVYDSLGEGFMTAGDRARAIESYERSLELNPDNQNAIAKLRELRSGG